MSVISPQKLSLDFNKNEVKIIGINQYDVNSRSVKITCTENGIPVIINSSTHTAQLKLMTSKNHMFLNRDCCEIQSDGTILVTFEQSMMYDAGKAAAQILITSNTNEGELLSTVQFGVVVRDSVFDDETYIKDYDEYSELSELLTELRSAVAHVDEYVERAETAADESEDSATLSQSYAVGGTGTRPGEDTDNAKYYSEHVGAEATESESWAVGGTGTRTGEDTDNSKYYSEQSSDYADDAHGWCDNKGDSGTSTYGSMNNAYYYMTEARRIAQALNGALLPMGSITFENLPTPVTTGDNKNVGYLYNITNDFTTTADFVEGAGIPCKAGSEVYITADGHYSIMTVSNVLGIKGNAETDYRTGLVNITPANIGITMSVTGTTLNLSTS